MKITQIRLMPWAPVHLLAAHLSARGRGEHEQRLRRRGRAGSGHGMLELDRPQA